MLTSCIRNKCIHGSTAKSAIGFAEAAFWRWKKVYKKLDAIVCCSEFMKKKLDSDPILREKTVAMHNFISTKKAPAVEKQNYVLYFGRFAKEKGIETFLKACKALPDIPFVAAGSGPLEGELAGIQNLKNVGFQSGKALEKLIVEARFSVYPSEWYENCPFSVMESLMYGTPVLGADIGGIPELIDAGVNGELFGSGNADALTEKIRALWDDRTRLDAYTRSCETTRFDTVEEYAEKTGFPIFVGIEFFSLQGDIIAFGIEEYPACHGPAGGLSAGGYAHNTALIIVKISSHETRTLLPGRGDIAARFRL